MDEGIPQKNWHAFSADKVIEILQTHLENGLKKEEARTRLEKIGPNKLPEMKRPGLLSKFLAQLSDVLIIILIVAATISGFVGQLTEAVVIISIVLLIAAMGVYQEAKAEEAIESLKKLAAPNTRVIRNGRILEIPAAQLVPGDVVLLETGDFIPADLRLVETENLKIEEAALTGESVPVEKKADIPLDPDVALADRQNSSFMGTIVAYGRGKGVVTGTGLNTEIGHIAKMLEAVDKETTPLQEKMADLGKRIGAIILLITVIIFALGLLRQQPILFMFMTAISLGVSAVPESLPAVVTIVLALGTKRMVSRHVIMRKLAAVETLGATTVICSDKTGTLTKNEMTVVRIYAGNTDYEVTGTGYQPEGEFKNPDGTKFIPKEGTPLYEILQEASLNSNAVLQRENDDYRIIGDPTEGGLITAAVKAGIWQNQIRKIMPRLQEIPFDSDRKRMTTIHALPGGGYRVIVKGAPDILLELCSDIQQKDRISPLNKELKQKVSEVQQNMAGNALRVLGVAAKDINSLPEDLDPEQIEQGLTFHGLLGIIDPVREEAVAAIDRCRKAGIRPVMITGDHSLTALAIARELKLDNQCRILTGADLNKMSDEELREAVVHTSIYARVTPKHKVRIVDALDYHKHIIAMTGDGVNDAPALKKANIGIAMGITGTDVAKNTADMILTDDNFASIVSAVEEGRIIFSNIRKAAYFLLSCAAGEVLSIFIAMILAWPIPLRPIHILWLNLISDSFPALALGIEKADEGIMERKPRDRRKPLLNRPLQIGMVVQALAITAATLGAFYYGWQTGSVYRAQTIAFATIVLSEVWRAYTSRSDSELLSEIGIFSNTYMNQAILVSIFLLVIVINLPFLNTAFQTVPLGLIEWSVIFGFSLIPALAAEMRKYLTYRIALKAETEIN